MLIHCTREFTKAWRQRGLFNKNVFTLFKEEGKCLLSYKTLLCTLCLYHVHIIRDVINNVRRKNKIIEL